MFAQKAKIPPTESGWMVQVQPIQVVAQEFLNPADGRDCVKTLDATGFSRVVLQFLPTSRGTPTPDTTDFSRVETQFQPPSAQIRWKLKLHTTEVGGVRSNKESLLRLKVKDQTAEAGGFSSFDRVPAVSEIQKFLSGYFL